MAWKFNDEPAAVFGSLGEIAKAVIPVLVLGSVVHWDAKLVAAVMFLVGAAVTALAAMFTRSQTVSLATANKQIDIALAAKPDTLPETIIQQAKEAA